MNEYGKIAMIRVICVVIPCIRITKPKSLLQNTQKAY